MIKTFMNICAIYFTNDAYCGGHNIKLDTKIMITFISTILLGLLVIVGTSSSLTISFSNSATDDAGNVLLEEELINIERLVKDKATLIDEYFDQITAEVNYLAKFAEEIFNDRLPLSPRTSYIGVPSLDSNFEYPENFQHSQLQNRVSSFETSAYYLHGLDSVDNIDQNTQTYIDKSSNLDFAFKSIFTANPLYIDAYMGFDSGLYRTFPYQDMTAWQGNQYISAITGLPITGFDPRHANFYVDGLSTGNPSQPNNLLEEYAISKPYIDPLGIGLEMTISHAAYFDNGTLIGVVGIDFTLMSIESTVTSLEVLKTGYAFLVDREMTPVIHPNLANSLDPSSLLSVEFDDSVNYNKEVTEFGLIFNEMQILNFGQAAFIKNGKHCYITYYPIITPELSLAIVVSEEEILASVNAIKSETDSILEDHLVQFLLISVLFSVLAVYVIKKSSEKIVDPIRELTLVTNQITEGNLRGNLASGGGGSKEIYLLYETFRGLVTALRFGNDEYYAGNLKRAMSNYQNALNLFTTMDNVKGVGICHNNIGNIQKAQGRLKEANLSYQTAIQIGKKLLEESNTEADKIENTLSLASRTNNIAMLFNQIENYETAEKILMEALEYDKKIDNKKGYTTRYGNLGLIFLAQQKTEKAKKAFYKAYEIACEIDSKRSIAFTEMNLGIYHRFVDDNERAKELFMSAVELAETLDIRVILTSLTNLREIYLSEGSDTLALEIQNKLESIKVRNQAPRNIIFALDYSGSMHGRRIRDARLGILNIFDNQIKYNDRVGVLLFNYKVKHWVNLVEKQQIGNQFYAAINSLERPQGGTAMYDGMGASLELISSYPDISDSWIIVLTDGDDNSSNKYKSWSIIKAAKSIPDINFVIIGVGDLRRDRNKLQKITASLTNGAFIAIEGGIANAITEAYEEVGTMLAEVDVEGFVVDH